MNLTFNWNTVNNCSICNMINEYNVNVGHILLTDISDPMNCHKISFNIPLTLNLLKKYNDQIFTELYNLS